jgi:hypothetical protein
MELLADGVIEFVWDCETDGEPVKVTLCESVAVTDRVSKVVGVGVWETLLEIVFVIVKVFDEL